MNKRVLNSLTELERNLVAETEKQAMAELDEDALLELHTRIRRARTKYVKLYRRQASAQVETQGGRGKAFPKNQRSRDKAEIFERALARVSRRVDVLAKRSAAELKAERLAAAQRTGSGPGVDGTATGPDQKAVRRARGDQDHRRQEARRLHPGQRGPATGQARQQVSAAQRFAHRPVVDPGSVDPEERAVLPLLAGPAVVNEVRAELDRAFGVEGAATGTPEDLQAGPAQVVVERHASWSGGRRPGAQQVRLVPHHERAVARPHQLFGGRGVGPTCVQAAAAVVVTRRQTARAGRPRERVRHVWSRPDCRGPGSRTYYLEVY